MRTRKTPRAIMRIREAIKDVRHDVRGGKMPKIVLKRIISCMEDVKDARSPEDIDYPLSYIILMAFLAVMSGAESWVDMQTFTASYKKKFNGIMPQYKRIGVPSHDTFRRVFGLINPDELQRATTVFVVEELNRLKEVLGIAETGMRHYALDGKEQKGTGRKYGTDQKVPNLQTLHCYDVTNGICMYSVPISEKSNEIPAAQAMLSMMQLKNCVFTFDAMNTQRDTVSVIAGGGGHYVGGLKGNHPLFYSEVDLFFSDETLAKIRKKEEVFYEYSEKSHNRIEKRSYYLTTDIKWFADLSKWAKLKSFICYEIEAEDLVSGKKTKERRYYISSLTDVKLCADAIRSHWSIENQLHWHLDVTFSEDDNSTMDKNAFNNLSILNKMALSLLKLIQPVHKIGLKGIRKKFGWDFIDQLANMLSLLDEDLMREALNTPFSKSRI
jgi:predicted transposase YbfD/YdcC